MIKKTLVLSILAMSSFGMAFGGGILTNTNQSARFARLMALEASTKADAAYYNPAGTIRLSEGFHFTFSNQSAFQERIINSTFEGYKGMGGSDFKQFKGTASAPVLPSIQGVYRKGKWALSGSISVVGGGGKATFNNGLSMFEAPISTLPTQLNKIVQGGLIPLPAGTKLSAAGYSVDQYMTGANYIFGGQIGGAYEINKMFSVYAGFRLNVVHNKYEGYLKNLQLGITSENLAGVGIPNNGGGLTDPTPIFNLANQVPNVPQPIKDQLVLPAKAAKDGAYLNSKQSGWGIAPILGVHFAYEGLNIGAKYEFKSSLDVENKTSRDDTGQFGDGVNTAHDVPALFAIGASYDIIKPLTVSVGYHHFFDKSAGMANDKQKELTGGTNEYLAGIEYRIDDMFLVSMGTQFTRYGLSDKFQSDLSFSVNSYSLGFGGAVNVSKHVQINVGYFFTDYQDYKMAKVDGAPHNVYTRKNKVFTAGVDFSF